MAGERPGSGEHVHRPITRSQRAAIILDDNPITSVQQRKSGIMKLGTGKTRVRQAKDSDGLPVPRDMTVTPSKPPGKGGVRKRVSKRKLVTSSESEGEALAGRKRTASVLGHRACTPVRTHCSTLVEAARRDSDSPQPRQDKEEQQAVETSPTPPSRAAHLLAQLLSPVSKFFSKEKTGSGKDSPDVEKRRERSRSHSKAPSSPEDLPDCEVSTHPISAAEKRASRRPTPEAPLLESSDESRAGLDSNDEDDTSIGLLQARAADQGVTLALEAEEGNDAHDPFAEAEDLDEEEEFDPDPYSLIKSLPPLEQVVDPWRRCMLPRQTRNRKTLVLDLDETLIHTDLMDNNSPECWFKMVINNGVKYVHVGKRPYLDDFLQHCSTLFEVVIFTASLKHYANAVIDRLDPNRSLVEHRLFRDSCLYVCDNYIKDLSVLGRDLSQTIIIDNSPQAFGFQVSNGIPIESWFNNPEDRELLNMIPFLETLAKAQDVRPQISEIFKVQQLVDAAPVFQLYNEYSE